MVHAAPSTVHARLAVSLVGLSAALKVSVCALRFDAQCRSQGRNGQRVEGVAAGRSAGHADTPVTPVTPQRGGAAYGDTHRRYEARRGNGAADPNLHAMH